jgi:hypothetical protein
VEEVKLDMSKHILTHKMLRVTKGKHTNILTPNKIITNQGHIMDLNRMMRQERNFKIIIMKNLQVVIKEITLTKVVKDTKIIGNSGQKMQLRLLILEKKDLNRKINNLVASKDLKTHFKVKKVLKVQKAQNRNSINLKIHSGAEVLLELHLVLVNSTFPKASHLLESF